MIAAGLALCVMPAVAQTTVTTSGGTTNTVPLYTGSATVGNSPISVSGGNVTINGQVLASTMSGASQGNFWNTLTAGKSSDGVFFGDYGVAHAGIKWNGTSLDFLNASSWNNDPDQWTGYTPLLTLNFSSLNVGIGTTSPTAKLEVDGDIKLTSGSGASITFPDGSVQSTAYTGVACGGDYAESVDVTGDRRHYGPGDLLVLDPNHPGDVLKSAKPYSTSIAGIYSTKPGYVGRRQTGPKSPNEVPMAMVGIVPAHVTAENGPIHVGDLLVSSSIPGYAIKGTDRSRMLGAVVGKAAGNLKSGEGVIEVLVTLQ